MTTDFNKVLEKIATDNAQLNKNHKQLSEALVKLDSRLNVLRVGVRIEPYPLSKDGPSIGLRCFHDGWHITTVLEGLAGLSSEIPVREATPSLQVAIVGGIGGLLDKVSKNIAADVKASSASVKEAETLLEALP